MIRYCDDIIIFSHDKFFLRDVFDKLEKEIKKYKLSFNKKKSFIVNVKDGFIFCGNYVKVDNKKTIVKRSRSSIDKIKRNMRKNYRLYKDGLISYRKYFTSVNSYSCLDSFTIFLYKK